MSLKLDNVRASYIEDFKLYPHFTNQLSSIWVVKCLITLIHMRRAEFDAPQVVYIQVINIIFRMPTYPMLNQWNAYPMTPNRGLWLVESNEASYEYWWEPISYAYLSNVDKYEYWWAEYFVLGQATPSDLDVLNPSALCPVDHACTLDHFWVTTYPLSQLESPGGASYLFCTQYKG